MLLTQALAIAFLASGTSASYGNNINFRSPSLLHPALGVSIRKVVARHELTSTWDPKLLNFTHGVARSVTWGFQSCSPNDSITYFEFPAVETHMTLL